MDGPHARPESGDGRVPEGREEGPVRLLFPDGVERSFPAGVTPLQALVESDRRLAREAVVARLDGELVDLSRPLERGGRIEFLTAQDPEGRKVLLHSAAHLTAQAVKRLWPEARLGVGPALEETYYYDIDLPEPLSADDLPRIEEAMRDIVSQDLPIRREVLTREEALELFELREEPYKLEIIRQLPEGATITAYRQGEFVDLCRGPHVPSTGMIRAFKLLGVAGSYWRGDEHGPRMQRISGTAFRKSAELEHFLWVREEARRRDHRKLGPELDLFSFHEEAPGFVFWHPKGWTLYRQLEAFSRELQEAAGYREVRTPQVFRTDLWKVSGHWEHYRENMFLMERDDEVLGLKPMNCPAHCLLYKEKTRSYRDLPLRFMEYEGLARYERSGTLHGLLRVRGMHQDDAHLFVREEQIQEEIARVLELVEREYSTFGMPYRVLFSTRPEDYMGELATWERAEAALRQALEATGKPYQINEGDGAFYGPKLDFMVTDTLGREWQCATVQLDFQLPERFDLTYVDERGELRRPVIIHRAILGSLERFIGILVEHYAGDFPLWLAPLQARIVPVADRHLEYARRLERELGARGLRVEVDDRNEKLGYKIRQAELEKVPYVLVVGDREASSETVALRSRGEGDQGRLPWEEVAARLLEEVRLRSGRPAAPAGRPG
ncbi:MAG: threonine--tRNA ligase [Bacillota bacterium]|nr:threonine--tRNA ligase [Bacillota bacterium]